MSDDLKPWEAGYVAPTPNLKTKSEAGAMGGQTAAARRKAGLPKIPVSDKTQKQGAKRTNVAKQEKLDKMTEDVLPLKKKLFLDQFIYHYLHDFNSSMAWIRAGGPAGHATTGGPESLRTAYVQKQLQILSQQMDEENMVSRGEIVMGIKKEANYYGDDGSSAARVRAWGMLAKIKGMDIPKPVTPEDEGPRGGVMEVPMIETVEQWGEIAQVSQLTLKQDVRK